MRGDHSSIPSSDTTSTANASLDAREAARAYARAGLYVVPIPHATKSPVIPGWNNFRLGPEEVDRYFDGRPQNVGLLLGASGLVDVDCDTPEAVEVARRLLPPTRTFGRRSKRRSHYIYRVEDRQPTKRYQLPEAGGPVTLVELRDTSGSGTSVQTVAPPSTHPTGEPVRWEGERGRPFATVSADEISRRVRYVAGAAGLARLYPREPGGRHHVAGALASVLARSGAAEVFSPGLLVGVIAEAAADEEAADRARFADSTVEALRDDPDRAVTGLPTLIEALAPDDTKRAALLKSLDWLDFSSESSAPAGAASAGPAPPGWSEPEPVLHPSDRAPVEPFDPDWLPERLAPWIEDVSDRMQLPLDYGAVSALTVASACVGRRVGIRPFRSGPWTVVPNLWGMIVGRPGQMKSPLLKEVTRPLMRLHQEANAAHEADVRRYESELLEHESRLAAGKAAARRAFADDPDADLGGALDLRPPDPPRRVEYVVHDATPEALIETARDNPLGFLHLRDEASGLLARLSAPTAGEERALYLSSWNGDDPVSQKRIGRGYVHADALCQSILGGIQPGKLRSLVSGALHGGGGDDGMLQRFQLLVHPDPKVDFDLVDRPPDERARREAFDLVRKLTEIDPRELGATQPVGYDGEPEGVPYLRFAPDAQAVFDGWYVGLERRLRKGDLHPAHESHLAKYRSLVPSLALLFHLAGGPPGGPVQGGPVPAVAVERAIQISQYLESHMLRVYAGEVHASDVSARVLARHLLDGDVEGPFSLRTVYRKKWSGLATKEAAQGAVDVLVDHGWLRPVAAQSGQRRSTMYEVNPALDEALRADLLPDRRER